MVILSVFCYHKYEKMKFYKDREGNVVFSKNLLSMEEMVANTVDAAIEKHVPVVSCVNGKFKVSVGEIHHPMEKEHLISFVYIETENEGIVHYFKAGEEPVYECSLNSPWVCVYSYCNLHGLWKVERTED